MTRTLTLFALFGPAMLTACGNAPSPEAVAAATSEASFTVTGMTCSSCEVTIKTAVNNVDGVGSVQVDSDAGTAVVTFDPDKVSASDIAKAITATGYNAVVNDASRSQ